MNDGELAEPAVILELVGDGGGYSLEDGRGGVDDSGGVDDGGGGVDDVLDDGGDVVDDGGERPRLARGTTRFARGTTRLARGSVIDLRAVLDSGAGSAPDDDGVEAGELSLDADDDGLDASGADAGELGLDASGADAGEHALDASGADACELALDADDEGLDASGADAGELALDADGDGLDASGADAGELALDADDEGLDASGADAGEVALDGDGDGDGLGAGGLALDASDLDAPGVSRKVRKRTKRDRPRSKTIAMKRVTRAELQLGALMYPPVEGLQRPRTRAECSQEARPCPWVSCKHHLYLDINPETGSIKINFPDLEPWEMKHTCSLDVADAGALTLEEIGLITNLTRERIRQVEVRGLLKLKGRRELR